MTAATPDPIVTVSVALPPTLLSLLDDKSAMQDAVEQGLSALMAAFGVPGHAAVRVSEQPAPADTVVRLSIDGRQARYPEELLTRTHAYVNRRLLEPDVKPATVIRWIEERFEGIADPARQQAAVDFIRSLCVEIVKLQPDALFGRLQAAACAEELAAIWPASQGAAPDGERLASLLGPLMEMGISIADRAAIAAVLARASEQQPPSASLEDLFDALRRESVEIRLSRPLLQQLTSRWEKDGGTVVPALRDRLFIEIGIALPPVRFVIDEQCDANMFAFAVNDIVSLPLVALQPDQLLVNEAADKAALEGFQARPTVHPGNRYPYSIIELGDAEKAESLGLTTWNQIQHLGLCLEDFLRRQAWRGVHRAGVRTELQTLEQYFPALVATFRSRHTDEELTALLRALVRDRVSVQNLRLILERWLDYGLVREQDHTTDSPDAALSSPAAFIRIGLGREIAHRAARTTSTVVVYLLDAEIERLASTHPYSQLGDHGDAILTALRAEMAHLPATALIPAVLTFVEARSTLQQLIAAEFSALPVLAHEELPPGINVQPVARITLAS